MKKICLGFVGICLLSVLSGCGLLINEQITHEGEQVTEIFNVGEFIGVNISMLSTVNFIQSDTFYVTATMKDSEIGHLNITVENGIMTPTIDSPIYYTDIENKPKFNIYAPTLEYINLSGFVVAEDWDMIVGENLNVNLGGTSLLSINVEVENLEVLTNDTAMLNISGYARYTLIDSRGSKDIYSLQLRTEYANITNSNSGNIDITVLNSLVAEVNDEAVLRYIGNPELTKSISGNGKIHRIY